MNSAGVAVDAPCTDCGKSFRWYTNRPRICPDCKGKHPNEARRIVVVTYADGGFSATT